MGIPGFPPFFPFRPILSMVFYLEGALPSVDPSPNALSLDLS